jgi:hypothetical protein
VAYWDGVTSLASPSGVYVDAINNRVGINVPVPSYPLDINGDINFLTYPITFREAGNPWLYIDTTNVALGVGTGVSSGTTAIGIGALSVVTGFQNTGIGASALLSTTTGASNTAIGEAAGFTNVTGANNVFVGSGADATAGNLTNAVAIGYQAVVAASDSMVLGDTSMKVGIHTSTPAQPLDVDGAVAFRHKNIAVANGLNSDIALTDASLIRLTGATGAFSIGGFTGGTDGRVLRIINTAAQAMTIVNLDASSAATNQITTLTGGNVVLAARTSACTLVYEDASDTWVLFSYN